MNLERWSQLSFAQQMGNIGSEIARAKHWNEHLDEPSKKKALERALELTDLTIELSKGSFNKLRELTRLREVLADWYSNLKHYTVSYQNIQDYCTQFILLKQK